jgi:hypothetical protein
MARLLCNCTPTQRVFNLSYMNAVLLMPQGSVDDKGKPTDRVSILDDEAAATDVVYAVAAGVATLAYVPSSAKTSQVKVRTPLTVSEGENHG